MASGRKNRGSRHRSHRQHHKQKVEDIADSDSEPSLRHGPLPESDSCSPWRMEPLPPHVEGPSALKQDTAENADNYGFGRKVDHETQKGLHGASLKRKKEVAPEVDAAVSSPPSLDRWDGGQSHADDTLSIFDFARGEPQAQEYDPLENELPVKELKSEGDGKSRKGKSRAIAGTQTPINNGQADGDATTNVKTKVSRRRDFSEFLGNEVGRSRASDIDGAAVDSIKGPSSGLDAGDGRSNARKVGPSAFKKVEKGKDSEAEFQQLLTMSSDIGIIESERKRGKTSEPLSKAKKMDDTINETDQLNAFIDAEKGSSLVGAYWAVQNDHRNLELEKELENRIRRRREESGERDKGKEGRRPYHQEDERGKVEGTPVEKLKDDKHRHEKVKDDSLGEKERNDIKHTGRPAEDRYKEEKLKFDKERFVKLKDDKEHDQRINQRRDKEEGGFEKNMKADRYREEKHRDDDRDDRPADNKDIKDVIKLKESKLRPRDKDKEVRLKEEKYQEGILNIEPMKAFINKNQGLFEGRKEEKEKDSGEATRDNYRRGRDRDKDDRLKYKDRGDKFERFKDEKVKEEKDKGVKHRVELDRDGIADNKGGYGKRKNEKEQDDAYKQREELDREYTTENKGKYDKHKFGKERVDDAVAVKYQKEKQKVERLQEGNLVDGRGKDEKYKASREGDGRWREERGKESKLQAHKDRDLKHKDDVIKPKKHEQVVGDRRRQEKDDNEKERHDRWKDAREERHGKLRDDREERGHDQVVHEERKKGNKDVGDLHKNAREKDDRQGFETRTDARKVMADKYKEGVQGKVHDRGDIRMEASGKSIDEAQSIGKSMDGTPLDVKVVERSSFELVKADNFVLGEGTKDLSTIGKKGLQSHGVTKEVVMKYSKDAEQDQTEDQVVAKVSRDERPMFRSGAMLASTPERFQEATVTLGGVDASSVERDPQRPGNRLAEEKDGFLDDDSLHHRSQEQRVSPFDALPRSPSPFHHSVHEKAARRAETSVSVSSSSGTRRPRERSRRVSEHLDAALQQQHGLDEEVRSWEPRMRSQDDRRGRSWSPDRYRDSQSSPSPRGSRAKGHEEPSRDRMRGSTPYEDGTAHERDHRRFAQGGGPTKVRRLDETSRDRSERIYQGSHSSRLPADRPLPPNRMPGPSGLLPPPPPFRPGIDNPAVLGNSAHSFDDGGPGPRDSGRYDRKSGGPFRRSEMPGSGETWRAVPMGNWQGHGPGPGGMFPPYGSGGFFGMGQQLPMPPFFGRNGMRPSTEMGFGGARFHMGDGVGFPGHTPNLGPVMGWHRQGEGDDSRFPLPGGPLDAWDGQGLYLDERQRFGLPEWDQGFPGRGFPDPWQGQAGDGGFGYNNSQILLRETASKGRIEDTPSQDMEEIQAVKEHVLDVMTEVKASKELLPANATDGVFKVGLMTGTRARQRMQAVLQSIDVSVKLAGVDLYKQYLDLLSPTAAKRREALLVQRELVLEAIDEDLQFEADPEAQDLLISSDHCSELLPVLHDGAFKEALEIYQKPAQENRVQKSLFGTFLLPLDSYAIKLPSSDAEAVLELGEKTISDEAVDGDMDATPLSEASLEDPISEEVTAGSEGNAVLLNEGNYEDPMVQNKNEGYYEDPSMQNVESLTGLIDTREVVLPMSAPMELMLVQDTSNQAVDLVVDYSCVPDEASPLNEDNAGQLVESEFLLQTSNVDLSSSMAVPVAEHKTVSVEVLAVTELTFEGVCGVRKNDEIPPLVSECNNTNFREHVGVAQLDQEEDSNSQCAQPIQREDSDCQCAQPIHREDSDSQCAQLTGREDCASQCEDVDELDAKVPALANTRMQLQEVAGLEASIDSEIDDDPKGKSRLGKSPEKACENTH